ncbi:MAG: hypothetical protein LQ347_001307 [Umbilicaria vellea]|nr:MAG: hypothetical protein LQ347_001307 [Umbilicaria vellea]
MVARLRKYTRLTISDERLKQYLHPTGLSNPRDNVFIVHQDDPSIAQRSEDPHPDIRAGLVNNSFEGKYALGSMRFRAPGGLITKHKALNRGTDGARKQELGNIEDPATDTTVQQTVHSSVRILMKKAKATSAVMEFRKTEISSQEDDSLGMKSRHVALHVDDEGEVLEDLLCDEEAHLLDVWIEALKDRSDDSTGDNDPTSAGINTQNVIPADDSEAERPAKTEEKKWKGLYFGRKRSERPRRLNTREVLDQLIHDAHELSPEGMYSPSEGAKTRIALLLGFGR